LMKLLQLFCILHLNILLVFVLTCLQASLSLAAGGDVANLDQILGVVVDCLALHHHLWFLLPQSSSCLTKGGHVQGKTEPAEGHWCGIKDVFTVTSDSQYVRCKLAFL
jgi:hypothetical protein